VEILALISPISISNEINAQNVKDLLLCVGIFRELRGQIPKLSQKIRNQGSWTSPLVILLLYLGDQTSIIKCLLEPFIHEEMSLDTLRALINYCNQDVSQGEKPIVFAFLERIQFSFKPQEGPLSLRNSS